MKNKNLRIVIACVAVIAIVIFVICKYNMQWKYAMFLEYEIDALREFKGVTSAEELPSTYISLETYYDLRKNVPLSSESAIKKFVNSLGVLNSDGEYNDFEMTFYTEESGFTTGMVAVRNNQFFVIKYNPARDSYSVKVYPATALAHERRLEEAADGYTYKYLDRFLIDEKGNRQIIYKTVGKQETDKNFSVRVMSETDHYQVGDVIVWEVVITDKVGEMTECHDDMKLEVYIYDHKGFKATGNVELAGKKFENGKCVVEISSDDLDKQIPAGYYELIGSLNYDSINSVVNYDYFTIKE